MACIARPIYTPLAEDLLRPELAVPTHEPISTSQAQPEPMLSEDFDARIAAASVQQTPLLLQSSAEIVVRAEVDAEPQRASVVEEIGVEDTPDVHLLQHETTVTPTAADRFSFWRHLLGIQPAKDSLKSAKAKLPWNVLSSPTACRTPTPAASSRHSCVGSSTEGSSLPASASTFTATSVASSRTSIDTTRVALPRDDSHIYLWCEERNIYLAKMKEVSVPPAMSAQWRQTVRDRLLKDICSVLQPLRSPRGKLIIEMELCMAGEPDPKTELVELYPAVLIRCSSKRCQRVVEDTVKDLDYLRVFSKGRIIIHQKAPRFASRSLDMTWTEGIDFDASTLLIARSDTQSGCALPILYTPGGTGHPRASIIGGLIRVDDVVYGLTTAHSVVEIEDDNAYDSDSSSTSDLDSVPESEIDTISTASTQPVPREEASSLNVCTVERPPMFLSPRHVDYYENCTLPVAYSYGQQRQPVSDTNAYSVSEGSDFALITIPPSYRHWPNRYLETQSRTRVQVPRLVVGISSADTDSVSIICSPTDVRSASLLDGDHFFLDGSIVFSTKKLQMQEALEQGLSGAWVVSGDRLLGIIVAVYDDEPYAHMLEITTVFNDIRALMSDGDRIPQITLVNQPLSIDVSEPQDVIALIDAGSQTKDKMVVPVDDQVLDSEKSSYKLNLVKNYLKEKFAIVGRKERDLSEKRDPHGARASLLDQLVLGSIFLAAFCIKLDVTMLPFLLRDITDDLGSLNHIGFYGSLYYFMAYISRQGFNYLLQKQNVRLVTAIALSTCLAGLLLSGLASNSYMFMAGRSLSAVGSAGIMSSITLLRTCAPDFAWCSLQRAMIVLECIAWVLGILLASSVVSGGPLGWWRACFLLDAVMLLPTTVVLAVNFRHRLLQGKSAPSEATAVDIGFAVLKVWIAATATFFSLPLGHIFQLKVLVTAVVTALFLCTIIEPAFQQTLERFVPWSKFSEAYPKLARLCRSPKFSRDTWLRSMRKSIIASYTGVSHFNASVLMFFVPLAVQTVAETTTMASGLVYLATLLPVIIGRLLVQPRHDLVLSLVIPSSLVVLSVGYQAAINFFSGSSTIGLLVIAELLLGSGIGMATSLRVSEDELSTTPELFEAAGIAMTCTFFLSGLSSPETKHSTAWTYRTGTGSLSDMAASMGDEYSDAVAHAFLVPLGASLVHVLFFGAPHIALAVWRVSRKLFRGHADRKEYRDIVNEARETPGARWKGKERKRFVGDETLWSKPAGSSAV